jgi:hypothetical protein
VIGFNFFCSSWPVARQRVPATQGSWAPDVLPSAVRLVFVR